MSHMAFWKKLEDRLQRYDKSCKKFLSNNISEHEFDIAFNELCDILNERHANEIFDIILDSYQENWDNSKINLIETEYFLKHEVRFISRALGSKNRLKPMIKESLVGSTSMNINNTDDIIRKFSDSHRKTKSIAKDSRHKKRKEKKKAKSHGAFIAFYTLGIGCIFANCAFSSSFPPEFTAASYAAGFNAIDRAVQSLV